MKNAEIAEVFASIARLLELQGEVPFEVRAYQRVTRELEYLSEDLGELAGKGELRSVPGVGDEIEKKILELLQTGKLEYYERLLAQVPPSILQLMDVPGVGAKMAARFWKELHVTDLEQMETALRSGQVAALPRMGAKTAANLLQELEALRSRKNVPGRDA